MAASEYVLNFISLHRQVLTLAVIKTLLGKEKVQQ